GARARIGPGSVRAIATAAALALVIGGAVLDVRGLRAPLTEAAVPAAYGTLSADPQPAAVLELPSGLRASRFAAFSSLYMYYQTAHRKYLLEGTVSRLPPDRRLVVQRAISDFAALPYVKWVVLHRDLVPQSSLGAQRQVEEDDRLLVSEGELVARDGAIDVYRLRTFRPETVLAPCCGPRPDEADRGDVLLDLRLRHHRGRATRLRSGGVAARGTEPTVAHASRPASRAHAGRLRRRRRAGVPRSQRNQPARAAGLRLAARPARAPAHVFAPDGALPLPRARHRRDVRGLCRRREPALLRRPGRRGSGERARDRERALARGRPARRHGGRGGSRRRRLRLCSGGRQPGPGAARGRVRPGAARRLRRAPSSCRARRARHARAASRALRPAGRARRPPFRLEPLRARPRDGAVHQPAALVLRGR